MKKILVVLAVAAFASSASALITGSKHDLTTKAGNVLGSCSYCHAPHLWKGTNVNVTTGAPPLWNRNSSDRSAYTIWPSTYFPVAGPGTRSLTCLSCHDGVADLGAVNNGAIGIVGKIDPSVNVGLNLQDDHPVGVVLTGTELVGYAAVKAAGVKLNYDTVATNYVVECNSCHDPHTQAQSFFLRVAQANLCSACHLK